MKFIFMRKVLHTILLFVTIYLSSGIMGPVGPANDFEVKLPFNDVKFSNYGSVHAIFVGDICIEYDTIKINYNKRFLYGSANNRNAPAHYFLVDTKTKTLLIDDEIGTLLDRSKELPCVSKQEALCNDDFSNIVSQYYFFHFDRLWR